jgi:hypothetical protein
MLPGEAGTLVTTPTRLLPAASARRISLKAR